MKKPALSLKLAFAERKGLLVPTGHAAQALANLPMVDFEPNELIEGSHPFLIDPIPINEKASLVTKAGICREEGIRTLDTLEGYTHFPGVLLQPLGHLSVGLIFKSECKEMNYSIAIQLVSKKFSLSHLKTFLRSMA
jgi:hypothetical protein